MNEKGERISLLHDTGPNGGKESCGQRFAAFGLVPEADFSPLDGRAYSALRGVVGRFHPLMIQEGEQMIPMLEESSGSTPLKEMSVLGVRKYRDHRLAQGVSVAEPLTPSQALSFISANRIIHCLHQCTNLRVH